MEELLLPLLSPGKLSQRYIWEEMLALREERENRFASHGTYVPLFFIYDTGMHELSEKKKKTSD